ncbi:hypothetical protein [Terricaulis sp.]|uniref:hypothetical protein n=1 Tax=Terricaulis sp. TaxID=2768686 RepID=UPI003784B440
MRQTVAADETILWIAHDDCASLPQSVVRLQQDGLSIRTCADLRSYNKIIPALEAFPAATIVTADDDLYYPRTWLQTLLSSRMAGVREVLCHRARRIAREGARLAPYKSWKAVRRGGAPSQLLFPLGVGGVLYPPGVLDGRVADITAFKQLCPTGDDIWLHWMRSLAGAPARCVGSGYDFAPWLGSQQKSLWSHNGTGGNDRQIANMIEAFGWPEDQVEKSRGR